MNFLGSMNENMDRKKIKTYDFADTSPSVRVTPKYGIPLKNNL